MNKLSKYMFAFGIIIIVVSVIRWAIVFSDMSQCAFGCAFGLVFLGFADIYNARKTMEDKFEKQDERINAFEKWLRKQEFK